MTIFEQYQSIKQKHNDCIIFFRIGEFYELFTEDAIYAANLLNLTLTEKNIGVGVKVPMCGFPAKSKNKYIIKLLEAQNKIAVVDEMRKEKIASDVTTESELTKLIDRRVVKIFTPGTVIDSEFIQHNEANYIISIIETSDSYNCAIIDLSTGSFQILNAERQQDNLLSILHLYRPTEIIVQPDFCTDFLHKNFAKKVSIVNLELTSRMDILLYLNATLNIDTHQFSAFSNNELDAIRILVAYIKTLDTNLNITLCTPIRLSKNDYLEINTSTAIGLELCYGFSGSKNNSLLKFLDKTITPIGKRLLHKFIIQPLTSVNAINERLDAVEFLLTHKNITTTICNTLLKFGDIQRIVIRCLNDKYTNDDILSLAENARHLRTLCGVYIANPSLRENTAGKVKLLCTLFKNILLVNNVIDVLVEEISHNDSIYIVEQYNLFDTIERAKKDFNLQLICNVATFPILLKYLINLKDLYNKVDELVAKFQKKLGCKISLHRKPNLGFYIEIAQNANINYEHFVVLRTANDKFLLTNKDFQSVDYEIQKILHNINDCQNKIIIDIVNVIKNNKQVILNTVNSVGYIDVLTNFAQLTGMYNYSRPQFVDGECFDIINGRHPIADATSNQNFIANSCNLSSDQKIWIITGPNMGGKSTFLRQNGLIAIMAHIGCFVPAEKVKMSIIDKIFARIGLYDSFKEGVSAFFNEMIDIGNIANRATSNSLCLIDELCAGTSFKEGLVIATNILKYLEKTIQPKMLFATHLHELTTEFEQTKEGLIKCYNFDYELIDGKILPCYTIKERSLNQKKLSYPLYTINQVDLPAELTINITNALQKLEDNISL